jgi:hypothetical protein
MTSTKLIRVQTEPLNTRLTSVENRSLVDEGDNVSVLVNDAGYQNAAQVDTKIQAVVGAAPAALDTLKEIADALADDSGAIAAISAVNTTQNTNIAALQTLSHSPATSISNAISINANQEINLIKDPSPLNILSIAETGLFVSSQTATEIAFSYPSESPDIFSASITVFDALASLYSLHLQELSVQKSRTSIARIVTDSNFSFQLYPEKILNVVCSANIVGDLQGVDYPGRHLIVKNSSTSTGTLTVNNIAIAPGEIYEIIADGTEWVEL